MPRISKPLISCKNVSENGTKQLTKFSLLLQCGKVNRYVAAAERSRALPESSAICPVVKYNIKSNIYENRLIYRLIYTAGSSTTITHDVSA